MIIFKTRKQLINKIKEQEETIKILQTTLEDCKLYIRNKAIIEASLKIELEKALNENAKLKGDKKDGNK